MGGLWGVIDRPQAFRAAAISFSIPTPANATSRTGVDRFVRAPGRMETVGDEDIAGDEDELERVFLQMAARGPKGSRPELVYARAGVRIGRWESAHDRLPPHPAEAFGACLRGAAARCRFAVRRGAFDRRTGRYALIAGEVTNAEALLRAARRLVGGDLPEAIEGDAPERAFLVLFDADPERALRFLDGAYLLYVDDPAAFEALLVRDPFGRQSVFYAVDGKRVLFATELSAAVAGRRRAPEPDPSAFLMYMTLQYIPAPATPFRDVHALLPGHRLRLRAEGLAMERYFAPAFSPVDRPEAEAIRAVRHAVERAFLRVWTPGQTGVLLSSGVDSAILAALARRAGGGPAFSLCLDGETDECPPAEATARSLGLFHRKRRVGPEEFFARAPLAVRAFGVPLGDPSAVALYLLTEAAAGEAAVVLSGEGSDEFFAGYRIYREPAALAWAAVLPPPWRRKLLAMVRRLPDFYGKNFLIRSLTPLEERYLGNAKVFVDDRLRVFHPDVRPALQDGRDALSLIKEAYTAFPPGLDDVQRMQLIDILFWLPNSILVKGMRSAAAHGLRLGLPFMDRSVFQVAVRMPTALKIRDGQTKWIVRAAFRDLLPPDVVERPKLGFPVPLRRWLQTGWASPLLERIDASPLSAWLDRAYVADLARDHIEGRRDNARKLYALYALALWTEAHLGPSQTLAEVAGTECL
ncbi:MAG: Asparagine synthetase [glutamine-hydrolyzing] [Hydrogenibacillus schlegelii]|uniref:asparagine synthase (glutamine-hydrolyzing) n=1 Tax=Hydrogenibacillus schlegelii TaxID=1484 RepID=A0A2T5G5W0_HYDSH|nr:asparagine synthase-related protein [Hydrogenibacillus schlegelii]PTQ51558.1 MAG: Asparagine synthetase [glutamine-hydrolyzing] [Hydrogenibacillus schlegelii]